jgi:hypothetical protein
LRRLTPNAKAQAVLVGTISRAGHTLYVSARLVDPADGSIISSTDYRLQIDKTLESMLEQPPSNTGTKQSVIPEDEAVPPPPAPRLNSWFKQSR